MAITTKQIRENLLNPKPQTSDEIEAEWQEQIARRRERQKADGASGLPLRYVDFEGDALRNEYIFTSGRRMSANCGIVGIDPDLKLSEGYDGDVEYPTLDTDEFSLTAEDMHELADMMIARWQAFKVGLK